MCGADFGRARGLHNAYLAILGGINMRLNALLILLLILLGIACLLALPQAASASFVASDFELTTTTEPTFKPGDVVIFDGILTNLSSQTAVFGGNITNEGFGFDFLIDGVPGPASPFVERLRGSFFPDQSIASGVR
jgi:hypothetical protein